MEECKQRLAWYIRVGGPQYRNRTSELRETFIEDSKGVRKNELGQLKAVRRGGRCNYFV
jgi:hypothetical protein